MKKTSTNDLLRIAEVATVEHAGLVGITFAPGKKGKSLYGAIHDRDVGADLDVIRDWGAAAVVTLIEEHEFDLLSIGGLGDAVRARHMDWLHLPIVDVSTPDDVFEASWREAGEGLRARLRDGFNILVHCRGGIGRAGTIACRLLVELGVPPDDALAAVRAVRPGAVETDEQEEHVRACAPLPLHRPRTTPEAIEDRAIGALVGLAIGDAVGTTLEFKPRDEAPPRLSDMVGGGPFNLKPGQWTDDTAMALALADSLLQPAGFDPSDLLTRFVAWYRKGQYSCTGTCFDIGITTSEALRRFERSGDPASGSDDPMAAGNGSLMRLSPVAIRFWNDSEMRRTVAAAQSRTTHGAAEAVDACVLYADILAAAIAGEPRAAVMRRRAEPLTGQIARIAAGSWRGKRRTEVRGTGYVADALEAALWCVGRTANFKDAVLLAANLCEDADTTAAIAGQLAGALYGRSGIPGEWLAHVAMGEDIAATARHLVQAADGPTK